MRVQRMCDVEIKIHHETEAAFYVSNDVCTEKIWIPKRIRKDEDEYEVDEGDNGWALITVPEWWAADKGLV